jgi:hypothetical protein
MRSMAILPSFQGQGLFQDFLSHLFNVLKAHGVNRVTGDVSPSNLVSSHIFNKMQFNVTGYTVSDRWGALTQFTKFLNPRTEAVFLDSFCAGIRPQAVARSNC